MLTGPGTLAPKTQATSSQVFRADCLWGACQSSYSSSSGTGYQRCLPSAEAPSVIFAPFRDCSIWQLSTGKCHGGNSHQLLPWCSSDWSWWVVHLHALARKGSNILVYSYHTSGGACIDYVSITSASLSVIVQVLVPSRCSTLQWMWERHIRCWDMCGTARCHPALH